MSHYTSGYSSQWGLNPAWRRITSYWIRSGACGEPCAAHVRSLHLMQLEWKNFLSRCGLHWGFFYWTGVKCEKGLMKGSLWLSTSITTKQFSCLMVSLCAQTQLNHSLSCSSYFSFRRFIAQVEMCVMFVCIPVFMEFMITPISAEYSAYSAKMND